MSRIIVKNLPNRCTEKQLIDLFSQKGIVTDVKLVKNHETGEFRHFAFIGYRDSESGPEAAKYFDQNYVGTCKITVEEAKPQSDASLKSWKDIVKAKSANPKAEDPEQSENGNAKPDSVQTYQKIEAEYDPNRLFLRNLSYTTTKEDIHALFSPYGEIVDITFPVDSQTQKPKGFAYVRFSTTEAAVEAFNRLDRSVFLGRLLHILPAAKKPELEIKIDEEGKSSYKKLLFKKLKARAKEAKTWNTLFLNPDTVAEAISQKLHTTKGEFMDSEHDNLAVRIAMAETKILDEVKKWMEVEGINYDSFNKDQETSERSGTVIIVKNLPPKTNMTDLHEKFSRYGPLGRVCLAPSHTIGTVEFLNPTHAQTAFEKLAYNYYKGVPIYLEWAPLETFSSDYHMQSQTVTKLATNTLFIKNLNFSTTKETLHEVFSKVGKIKSLKISTKNGMPCGFGFVEYDTEKSARKALSNLNNVVVDGHALKLSEAKTSIVKPDDRPKKRKREKDNPENDARTKLLIKNLAFEANKNEIKELFANFGTVKSVRIPKKANGVHRGFGFVDFVSHEEAAAALESLKSTHMYGRRLCLEWAQQEETISSARHKLIKTS
jgi:multiple RNA-binding domain-containing protein 1